LNPEQKSFELQGDIQIEFNPFHANTTEISNCNSMPGRDQNAFL